MSQPKTANLVRTIYLPQKTIDLLTQEHTKHPGNPIMFPSPVTGNLCGPDCVGRLHKILLKKAGITENISLHGLRHTYVNFYNHVRPHQALAYKAPARFEEPYGKEETQDL